MKVARYDIYYRSIDIIDLDTSQYKFYNTLKDMIVIGILKPTSLNGYKIGNFFNVEDTEELKL